MKPQEFSDKIPATVLEKLVRIKTVQQEWDRAEYEEEHHVDSEYEGDPL